MEPVEATITRCLLRHAVVVGATFPALRLRGLSVRAAAHEVIQHRKGDAACVGLQARLDEYISVLAGPANDGKGFTVLQFKMLLARFGVMLTRGWTYIDESVAQRLSSGPLVGKRSLRQSPMPICFAILNPPKRPQAPSVCSAGALSLSRGSIDGPMGRVSVVGSLQRVRGFETLLLLAPLLHPPIGPRLRRRPHLAHRRAQRVQQRAPRAVRGCAFPRFPCHRKQSRSSQASQLLRAGHRPSRGRRAGSQSWPSRTGTCDGASIIGRRSVPGCCV